MICGFGHTRRSPTVRGRARGGATAGVAEPAVLALAAGVATDARGGAAGRVDEAPVHAIAQFGAGVSLGRNNPCSAQGRSVAS